MLNSSSSRVSFPQEESESDSVALGATLIGSTFPDLIPFAHCGLSPLIKTVVLQNTIRMHSCQIAR